MKTKIVTGILFLAAIAFVSGVTIMAMATPGTQEDPFVTLNYLNNSFRPQLMAEIRNVEQEMSRAIDTKIAVLETQMSAGQGNAAQSPGSADRFSVVTLNRGQSLRCSAGTEIMLRIGSASGFGAAPAIINYTTGAALSDGAALEENNMYLVTIEGNGIIANADTVRVLVRGMYTVG